MGKTDKTQPYQIKKEDPAWRYKRLCSCVMCSGYNMAYLDHRVARMRQRKLMSILTKTPLHDLDILDTNIPKTDRWYIPRRKGNQ